MNELLITGLRTERRRLYLSVGTAVFHLRHPEWGQGRVSEVLDSLVPGGASLARINFKNAGAKLFDNNIDSQTCCYQAGIRKIG